MSKRIKPDSLSLSFADQDRLRRSRSRLLNPITEENKASHVEFMDQPSWKICSICTLQNTLSAASCEACETLFPVEANGIVQISAASSFSPSSTSNSLNSVSLKFTIMSINIWFDERQVAARMSAIASVVLTNQPDFLWFETESVVGSNSTRVFLVFRKPLPII